MNKPIGENASRFWRCRVFGSNVQFNLLIALSIYRDRWIDTSAHRNKEAVRFWYPDRKDPFSGQCVDTTSFSGCLSNSSTTSFCLKGLYSFSSLSSFSLFPSLSSDFVSQTQGRFVDLTKCEGKVFYNFLSLMSINLTLFNKWVS